MYRYYRRMRMELERLDLLFPETREAHRRYGRRRPDRLAAAPAHEQLAWWVFAAALAACAGLYRVERAYYQHWSRKPCDPWPVIDETKQAPCAPSPR